MNEWLSAEPVKVCEWSRENRIDFNASKTLCSLLTNKRTAAVAAVSLVMGATIIEEREAVGVFGMKIQCDMRWNKHIFHVTTESFKSPDFLNVAGLTYFTPSDFFTITPQFNSHVLAVASKSIL